METVEIAKSEYDALKARPTREKLTAATERAEKAEKDIERLEAEKATLATERDELAGKVTAAEEQARRHTLRDERIGALGAGFTAKLGEKTKSRLQEQAGAMSDEDWTARLEEVEEAYGVKRDEGASDGDGRGEFSREEVARSNVGPREPGNGNEPSATARRSVVAGLASSKRR